MALTTYWKHYFYRRYVWLEGDFEKMQDSETGAIEGLFEGLTGGLGAVLEGFDDAGASGLDLTVGPGIGCTPAGELLAKTGNTVVTVAGHASIIKNLIVLRKNTQDVDDIVRPTSPFDVVPLRQEITAEIAVISGVAGGGWPSAEADDVVLLGVEASAAAITAYDRSKCQLLGKADSLKRLSRHNVIVANQKWATHRNLADAVAAIVAGDRVRVAEDQTIDATLTVAVADVQIDVDPVVAITKGSAATGLVLNARGVRLRGGKVSGYTAGGDVGIHIGSAATGCTVADVVFLNSPNGVMDSSPHGGSVYGIQIF